MTFINNLRMKKSLHIWIAIFVIIAIIYIFAAQKIGGNRELQFFVRFDTTDIQGKIDYAKIGHYGSVFKIEGIEEEFIFYPFTSELNSGNIFYNIAEKGDVVVKQAHSDTLRLMKNDKVYLYTFQKFQ